MAILLQIVALLTPVLALVVLVALFGARALIDGIFGFVTAMQSGDCGHARCWNLLEGLAGVIVGLLTFFWPAMAALVLLFRYFHIAVWSLVTRALEFVQAVELRSRPLPAMRIDRSS